MEYRYYRELKHNYLILEAPEKETEDERYQYKILESGRIKNLVPCTLRNINGEKYYYYEINSMQSLKDRFGAGKMDYDKLTKLLMDIRGLMDGLSEFLLGQEGLVFNLQSVYTDLSGGNFKFIYCPFHDEKKSFSDFALELLEIVDEDDKMATDLIYKLCEESANLGDFIYEVIDNVTEDTKEEIENDDPPEKVELMTADPWEEEIRKDDEESPDEPDSRLKRANKRLSGKIQLFFSLMFMLLVGAMVYIRMNYILSSEENVLSVAVMVISAITGAVALIGGFKEMKKDTPTKDASKQDDGEDEYEDEDLYDTDDLLEQEEIRPSNTTAAAKVYKRTESFSKNSKSAGETVVLDAEINPEPALFSRNLDRTVRIPLINLPITIGKMEECVDMMLSDPSISRMHCRIEEENGRPAVRDLGSTNGTYRNGLRLKPQESVIIEEGDEIRIGRVCFDCR